MDALLGQIASLPPDENPYTVLGDLITKQARQQHLAFFYPLLYATLALYGLLGIVTAVRV